VTDRAAPAEEAEDEEVEGMSEMEPVGEWRVKAVSRRAIDAR
jgi:hypothetical protein